MGVVRCFYGEERGKGNDVQNHMVYLMCLVLIVWENQKVCYFARAAENFTPAVKDSKDSYLVEEQIKQNRVVRQVRLGFLVRLEI